MQSLVAEAMLTACLPQEAEAVSCQTMMKIVISSGLEAGSDLQEVLETGEQAEVVEL